MADTLAERLRRQRTRTEEELDALGEGMDSTPPPPRRAPPDNTDRQRPQEERRGTGRDFADENRRRLVAGLNARIEAARRAGNVDLVRELEARKKALEELQ